MYGTLNEVNTYNLNQQLHIGSNECLAFQTNNNNVNS